MESATITDEALARKIKNREIVRAWKVAHPEMVAEQKRRYNALHRDVKNAQHKRYMNRLRAAATELAALKAIQV